MTLSDDAQGSGAGVSADSRSNNLLPLPESLTNEELLNMESVLLDYVREIARVITERVHRVAAETGLDLPKLQADTKSETAL
jgi:hypothetical protein